MGWETAGISTENRDPLSFVLSTVMDPPWRSTIQRAIANPSPAPPPARPRAITTRKKRSNYLACSAAEIPIPVSRTLTTAR